VQVSEVSPRRRQHGPILLGPPEEPREAQQVRLLIEQLPAIAWTADRAGCYTSIDGAGLEELGLHPRSVRVAIREALAGTEALCPSLAAHERALNGERATEILRLAAVIALTHHEWFDGTGYPQGLAGEAIPLPRLLDLFQASPAALEINDRAAAERLPGEA
jgi:PAS domain-containing protein